MRSSAEQHRRAGMADACVLLTAKRILPRYDLADWGDHLGVTHAELTAAVERFKARAEAVRAAKHRKSRPTRDAGPLTRDVHPNTDGLFECTVASCKAEYKDRRGLAVHLRTHQTARCPGCGREFSAHGLNRHKPNCAALQAPQEEAS